MIDGGLRQGAGFPGDTVPGHWGRAGAQSPLRPLGSLSDALEATLPPLDGEDEM